MSLVRSWDWAFGPRKITFAFTDNEAVTFSLDDLTQDQVDALALHGLRQRMADAAVLNRYEPAEARVKMLKTWKKLSRR